MMDPEVTTTNLNIAAFLLGHKFELARLSQIGPTVFFHFRDPQHIGRQVIDSYYRGATMCVLDFVHGLKVGRDKLFEHKRQAQHPEIEHDQAQQFTGR